MRHGAPKWNPRAAVLAALTLATSASAAVGPAGSERAMGRGSAASEAPGAAVSGRVKSHWLEKGYELVVYAEEAPGAPFPRPEERPTVSQRNLVYVPHVLPIVQGWEVEFRSEDTVVHNIMARFRSAMAKAASLLFNVAMPPRSKPVVRAFDKAGVVTLLCNVHPEMSAYLLVLQNPYFAKVGKTGAFELRLPPGKYDLKVWGEKLERAQIEKKHPITAAPGAAASVDIAP